jgi:hypothetical protein
MKALFHPILATVLMAHVGCGPRPAAETEEAQVTDAGPAAQAPSEPPNYPTPPLGMPFHGYNVDHLWAVEKILERHEMLFMKPLPDYVIGLAGWGGEAEEGGFSSLWAFIVPQDKIQDFRRYIVDLGVPEEYLDKEVFLAAMSRPLSWRPPDPPATELIFLESFVTKE